MAIRSKVLLSLVALVTLVASAALLFDGFGVSLYPMSTHAAGVTSTDYSLPGGSDPWGTTFDSKGNVWLAIPGCDPSPMCSSSTPPGKIAVFNPTGPSWSKTYTLPSGYAQPLFLAIDSQGNVWFPMPMDNSIGMLNPSNNTFQQWAVPTASSGPWDIAIDHNGMIWFTEHYGNKIGRFNPSNHTFMEIATPASNSQPYGITVDKSNNVWFTENSSAVALIGEYTSGGQLREYKIRTGSTSNLTPHLITVDPNGNIWWSEGWSTAIGELVVSKASPGTNNGVTEYTYKTTCSNCGSHTSGISVDGYGQIWFDDSLQSIFGSFPGSGSGSFAIYTTQTTQSHPHDGMNVDSQNRIFFDEEFANKLAEAVQSGVPTPSPVVTGSSTPWTTLAQDTFMRANQTHWGTATAGQSWGGDANSQNAFAIASNSGQVTNGGSVYNAVLGPSATNAEVLFSGSLSSLSNTNFGAVLRWTDANNWYKAYIDGTSLQVQKKVAGSTTMLGTASFSAVAATSYSMRFRVVGTSLSAKVWATSGSEPSTWMVTATDSSLASGYCGLRMQMSSSAVLKITSFLATAE
jgi:streptogramin lyase